MCSMRYAVCGMRCAIWRVRSVECGVRRAVCGGAVLRFAVCGMRWGLQCMALRLFAHMYTRARCIVQAHASACHVGAHGRRGGVAQHRTSRNDTTWHVCVHMLSTHRHSSTHVCTTARICTRTRMHACTRTHLHTRLHARTPTRPHARPHVGARMCTHMLNAREPP